MLKIGQPIPEFAFEAYQGDEIKKMKLSGFKGRWLILIFYPGDFTFICPTELEEAADNYEEFKKLGAEILSVSTDSVHVHKAWHDKSEAIRKVKFPMAADPTGRISQLFDIYIEEGEDEGRSLRGTFVIDPDGVLKTTEVHSNDIGRSVRELLRKLKAAKFVREHKGQVCPASWEEGEETLTPRLDLVGEI